VGDWVLVCSCIELGFVTSVNFTFKFPIHFSLNQKTCTETSGFSEPPQVSYKTKEDELPWGGFEVTNGVEVEADDGIRYSTHEKTIFHWESK
jgi:hypothetical protein